MHKVLVRFGIMHVVATNICCWLVTTVVEANEDFRTISTHELVEQQQQQSTVVQHRDINGRWSNNNSSLRSYIIATSTVGGAAATAVDGRTASRHQR